MLNAHRESHICFSFGFHYSSSPWAPGPLCNMLYMLYNNFVISGICTSVNICFFYLCFTAFWILTVWLPTMINCSTHKKTTVLYAWISFTKWSNYIFTLIYIIIINMFDSQLGHQMSPLALTWPASCGPARHLRLCRETRDSKHLNKLHSPDKMSNVLHLLIRHFLPHSFLNGHNPSFILLTFDYVPAQSQMCLLTWLP